MSAARRKRPQREYSVCAGMLLLRYDTGTRTRITAVRPEWMMVSIGEVTVEVDGGRVVIRHAVQNTILHEGGTPWG